MVGNILESGRLDPTIVNGGIINSLSKNNKFGKGKWMVVEADESDGSFLKLPHEISIITNLVSGKSGAISDNEEAKLNPAITIGLFPFSAKRLNACSL